MPVDAAPLGPSAGPQPPSAAGERLRHAAGVPVAAGRRRRRSPDSKARAAAAAARERWLARMHRVDDAPQLTRWLAHAGRGEWVLYFVGALAAARAADPRVDGLARAVWQAQRHGAVTFLYLARCTRRAMPSPVIDPESDAA